MGSRTCAIRKCDESESLEDDTSESSDMSESYRLSDANDIVFTRGTGEVLFNRPNASKVGSPFDLALLLATRVPRSDFTLSSFGGKKHVNVPFIEKRAPHSLGRGTFAFRLMVVNMSSVALESSSWDIIAEVPAGMSPASSSLELSSARPSRSSSLSSSSLKKVVLVSRSTSPKR